MLTFIASSSVSFSRRKSILSREKLKLLYKQHCEPQRGFIMLKVRSGLLPVNLQTSGPEWRVLLCQASTVKKFQLSEQIFSQFFPDEPPQFPFSSPSSNGGACASPGQVHTRLVEEMFLLGFYELVLKILWLIKSSKILLKK